MSLEACSIKGFYSIYIKKLFHKRRFIRQFISLVYSSLKQVSTADLSTVTIIFQCEKQKQPALTDVTFPGQVRLLHGDTLVGATSRMGFSLIGAES